MKKIFIISILMILVLIIPVNAQTLVGEFFDIEWAGDPEVKEKNNIEKTQGCSDEKVFQDQIKWWNEDELFQKIILEFENGYHVLHLTEHNYKDSEYFTLYKVDDEIMLIQKGFCVHGNDYELYTFDLDIAQIESKLTQEYQEGNMEPVTEGYKILQHIEGINFFKKLKLVSIATKHMATHTIYSER